MALRRSRIQDFEDMVYRWSSGAITIICSFFNINRGMIEGLGKEHRLRVHQSKGGSFTSNW